MARRRIGRAGGGIGGLRGRRRAGAMAGRTRRRGIPTIGGMAGRRRARGAAVLGRAKQTGRRVGGMAGGSTRYRTAGSRRAGRRG